MSVLLVDVTSRLVDCDHEHDHAHELTSYPGLMSNYVIIRQLPDFIIAGAVSGSANSVGVLECPLLLECPLQHRSETGGSLQPGNHHRFATVSNHKPRAR